jgi:E3 ubiquitin-protein ligase synoviolin
MIYTIKIVIQQARPNMMVMFLFEFAVLMVSSTSTILRYVISLIEARIIKRQTQERLESRRREIREEREEILRRRASAESSTESSNPNGSVSPALPSEDDIDEMDIEVPGWEAKGHWVLTLDLVTGKCNGHHFLEQYS